MNRIAPEFASNLFDFYKDVLNRIRSVNLTQLIKGITHEPIIPLATYAPWKDDQQFATIYSLIKNNTLVDRYRCYELWSLVRQTKRLAGVILEVGVWRGGTGALLAAAATHFSPCTVYLADTFKGVVKASERDSKYKGGEHDDTSVEEVQELLQSMKISNTKLLVGIFPDQTALPDDTKLKICHIDVDTYQSAHDIFYHVWPLMQKGGVVVFDDYGFWGCEGVTSFCNSLDVPDGLFIYNVNGHAVFVKV